MTNRKVDLSFDQKVVQIVSKYEQYSVVYAMESIERYYGLFLIQQSGEKITLMESHDYESFV